MAHSGKHYFNSYLSHGGNSTCNLCIKLHIELLTYQKTEQVVKFLAEIFHSGLRD